MDLSRFSLDALPLDLFIKIVFLIFIGFMVIYAIMLLSQVRSFSRVVSLKPTSVSAIPLFLTLLYLLATVSLFLVALVIL